MKKEPKFKCGNFVKHKTGMVGFMLIVGAGSLTDIEGNSTNIYLVSFEHIGEIRRMYITEAEIELYTPKK